MVSANKNQKGAVKFASIVIENAKPKSDQCAN